MPLCEETQPQQLHCSNFSKTTLTIKYDECDVVQWWHTSSEEVVFRLQLEFY